MSNWVRSGVGPFLIRDHIALAHVTVDGEQATFDHSSAYAQWGDLMVELITLHDSPRLAAPTGTGIHHMAHFVDDLGVAAESLTQAGCREVLRAETADGSEFRLHDTRVALGHLTELYEPTDRLTGFYRRVRTVAEHWDGTTLTVDA